MAEENSFVLEKGWDAQTGRTWKIEFAATPADKDHFYYCFTCTPREGDGFIFTCQVSRALLRDVGIDSETKPKLVLRVVAGQGLEDLKKRLNAGHDHNFNNLPYCKTYTSRDAEKLKKYLPK